MRGATYAALVAAGLVLAAPSAARACSCAGVASVEAAVHEADAAFVGTVEAVDVPLLLREPWIRLADSNLQFVYLLDPEVRTRFKVERNYRGPLGELVEVNTGNGFCCNCTAGASFVPGERWLVAGYESDGELHVSTCNLSIGEAFDPEAFAATLARLGPGARSPHPRPRFTPQPTRWWWWLLLGSPMLLVALRLRRRAAARSES